MDKPTPPTKRSSVNLEETKPVIKRQCSERTFVANEIEKNLLLESAPPRVMLDQRPCLSPNFEMAPQTKQDTFDLCCEDSTIFEDSKSPKSTPNIKRERRTGEPDSDDYNYLSVDVENEHVSFKKAVMDDVPIIHMQTKTTEAELEGEDEPDGRGGFFGRIDKFVDDLPPHHNHHDNEVDHDLEGFIVHVRSHQFDCPRPFGARLRRSDEGYIIAKILRDTAAHKADLRESDIVTHLNVTELKMMEVCEIQTLFVLQETVFTLTILRKCGEDGHLEKTTIKVTISDEIVVEVLPTEETCNTKPRHICTSARCYIYQDGDNDSQIYVNATEGRLTMGYSTDVTAHFYLDFYTTIPLVEDVQRCVIRHETTSTTHNEIYDAVQNIMKEVKKDRVPDEACMLDKKRCRKGTFTFESVEKKGEYLRCIGRSLELCECSPLTTAGCHFYVRDVERRGRPSRL